MNYIEFKDNFNCKLNQLNITLEDKQFEQFYTYMNLLIEWNKKMNLTAIIEPKDIILKHFIDSLTVSKYINNNDSIVDIGTGAGFPGIPLKILEDKNKFVLIDSLNKRINFLNEVINVNNFENIEAVHARAEEIGHNKQYREQFDIATSRAVAKLNVLIEYMIPLIKVGGRCICLKGPNIDDEINEAQNALKILGGKIEKIEKITLPDSDNERTLVIITKTNQLPNKYPRKPGTPTDSPL